jgi:hypothetical protein
MYANAYSRPAGTELITELAAALRAVAKQHTNRPTSGMSPPFDRMRVCDGCNAYLLTEEACRTRQLLAEHGVNVDA